MKIDVKKLEMAMACACMNASEIASKAEISRQTVATAKQGKRIGPATVGKIAKALGVDPEEIIEKDDE